MIPSLFYPPERQMLLLRRLGWVDLPKTAQTDDGKSSYKPRERYMRRTIEMFFEEFPERDIERSPDSPIAFTQEIRDGLHKTIKKLYHNHASKTRRDNDAQESDAVARLRARGVSALSLFKQRFKERIKNRRDRLLKTGEYNSKLSAYNAAVKLEYELFREEEDNEFDALQELADKVKTTQAQEYEAQDLETREAVLEMLPVEIAQSLNDWQRRTGACIYVMAVWNPPGGGQGIFDYATKNCGRFIKSRTCERIRSSYDEWMKSEKGAALTGDIDDAYPAIYPDENGFPQYPNLENFSVSLRVQIRLLRRYFTLLAASIGGAPPSYERIAEDMKAGTREWIPLQSMPATSKRFDDPKYWSKNDANAWGYHLVAGQTKSIPPERRFRYKFVPGPRGTCSGPAPAMTGVPIPGAQICWATDELMYAEKMQQAAPTRSQINAAYRDLPPARCSHVYQPFKAEVFAQVELIHKYHPGLVDLFREIALMEELGPIHNTTGFSDSSRTRNPHIPHSRVASLAKTFLPSEPLPIAFFDSHNPLASDWSPQAFLKWLLIVRPHIHPESDTTYGGPRGVRQCAMGVSRMWQNVEYVDDDSLPADIRPKVHGPNRTWKDELTRETLDSIVTLLRRDVARSRTILMVTFPQRAELWRQGVVRSLKKAQLDPELPEVRTPDRGVTATSGVPLFIGLLAEMSAAIDQASTDPTRNEDYDVSQIIEMREEGLMQTLRPEHALSDAGGVEDTPDEPGTLSSSRVNTPPVVHDTEQHPGVSPTQSNTPPMTESIIEALPVVHIQPRRSLRQATAREAFATAQTEISPRGAPPVARGNPSTRGRGKRGRRGALV